MNNNTMAGTGGSNAPAGGVGGTQQHRLDLSHPFFVGADIVRQAKYVELDEQVRAEGDPFHVKVVERLYKGGGICRSDLEKYKLLSEDDYKGSQAGQGPLDSGWHRAPIIVTTNRERYSLTHEAACRFAQRCGQVVIRWKVKYSRWRQKPPCPQMTKHALEDPCFYEYFVNGADGTFSGTVNKDLGLVNAAPYRYHSISLKTPAETETFLRDMEGVEPGTVITLPDTPLSVNVLVKGFDRTQEQLGGLLTCCMPYEGNGEGRGGEYNLLIPVVEGLTKVKDNVAVRGGVGYSHSRVTIRPNFPLGKRLWWHHHRLSTSNAPSHLIGWCSTSSLGTSHSFPLPLPLPLPLCCFLLHHHLAAQSQVSLLLCIRQKDAQWTKSSSPCRIERRGSATLSMRLCMLHSHESRTGETSGCSCVGEMEQKRRNRFGTYSTSSHACLSPCTWVALG